MIPEFTEDGWLPKGVHRATLEEFKARFVYFKRSDRRFRIFEKLQEVYWQAQRSGIVKQFVVGGSFVANQAEPGDFDCILVLDPKIEGRELRPAEYNLVSRQRARRLFGGDVIATVDGSREHHAFLEFFQMTRDKNHIGVVEIEL